MKMLAFLKTHYLNKGIINEYRKLKKSGVDTLLVFDNKSHKFAPPQKIITLDIFGEEVDCYFTDLEEYEKINLPGYYDDKSCKDLNRFMWYNSDYPLYDVYHKYSDYDYYWQIEYDVFCNGKSYKPFFEIYKKNPADLLISHYAIASNDWFATQKVDWIYPEYVYKDTPITPLVRSINKSFFDKQYVRKYASIFPVLRISNRAVKYCYEKRLEHAKIYRKTKLTEDVMWPFCEMFLPTEISNNPTFSVLPIYNQYITQPDPDYNIFLDRIFKKPDDKLYHPVR